MKHRLLLTTALALLSLAPPVSHAELLVYEPFNYAPVNDEVNGRLEGKNGGLGWGDAWIDSVENSGGYSFIYDSRGNAPGLYGGAYGTGQPNWDGMINNLAQIGHYAGLSSWSSQAANNGRLNAYRRLARSAGAMAANNGGVLWLGMGVHFPNNAFFITPTVMLTTTDSYLTERGRWLSGGGSGVGTALGEDFNNAALTKDLNPLFMAGGAQVVKTTGVDIPNADRPDCVVILKFEFGELEDTVRVWYFSENATMDEATFDANAISCTDSIDEVSLDTFTFAIDRQENAIDEIRIGTTFNDVITLPPAGPVDLAISTVRATPASASADGSSTSTITVTLRDSVGIPVAGKNVTLANTAGPQAAVIAPPGAQTTDVDGRAAFTVSSSTAGTEVFTATDTTDSLVLAETASVTFVSLPDAAASTVAASPCAVLADGSLVSTITVTLKDAGGFPVPGKSVTLANTEGPQAAVISPAGAQTTDAKGQAAFNVSSSTAGTEVFAATDMTDSLVITQTATVSFVDLGTPLAFNVNYWRNAPTPGSPEDPGTLVGPRGGLGETWNQANTTSGTNLLAANGVLTHVGFTITAPSSWDWGNPDLRLLQSGLTFFGKGEDTTLTITGLKPGGTYDVWLASHANNAAVAERASGTWSTPNATSTTGGQIIDSLSSLNGTNWQKGNNYVLFESVVADTQGQIVFNGDATDAEELGAEQPAYRLPLNGWQIQEPIPLVLASAPNAANRGHYDFTWDSRADKIYDLVSATSLSTPISTWPVWDGQADLAATPPRNTLSAIPGGGDAQRFFALIAKRSPVLLNENFEEHHGGFVAVGTPNDWAWGIPNSDNASGLVLTAGNGGSTKCWGTSLGDGSTPSGLVTSAAYSILQSPPIDFAGLATAALTFAAAVDAGSADTIYIDLFDTSTGAWLGTLNPITVPRSAGWASFGPLDISVAAGTAAYLQFVFVGTDGARIGLYIDDVVVIGQ
ncbi:MAG TPA: Ig-like domain-containing protein [Verrucomicrobiota bacterium]|nr:Ig-like domain-containing protein [Verrucomicrobiota bacterium]HNU52970.1 Ig-like domain-containing protein [Verrucomicrobiota bacterium]